MCIRGLLRPSRDWGPTAREMVVENRLAWLMWHAGDQPLFWVPTSSRLRLRTHRLDHTSPSCNLGCGLSEISAHFNRLRCVVPPFGSTRSLDRSCTHQPTMARRAPHCLVLTQRLPCLKTSTQPAPTAMTQLPPLASRPQPC